VTLSNSACDCSDEDAFVGLIPAAGWATRLQPLPCSKEIFPIEFDTTAKDGKPFVRVVCSFLLENMRLAGVKNVFVVLRKGKWDILEYLGTGASYGLHLAYLLTDVGFGVPFTLDYAYPFVKNKAVVFGFPDIIFEPADAFLHLKKHQQESEADITLGLFPASDTATMDMVEFGSDSQVLSVNPKPSQTNLKYTWIIAIWRSAFSTFMHNFVRTRVGQLKKADGPFSEIYIGHLIHEAIQCGLKVDSVVFPNGRCFDIGRPRAISVLFKKTILSKQQ
jgi:glucose-1-phosphate thymidylyltransferase